MKLYAKWLLHSHTWAYQIDATHEKIWVYCTTNTAADSPCEHYGTSPDNCANPYYVQIATTDVETTGAAYTGLTTTNTLTGSDVSGASVGAPVYYLSNGTTLTDSANSGASSSGAAPVNPGDYVVKITITDSNGGTHIIYSEFTILRKTYSVTYVDTEFSVSVPASIPVGTLHEGDLITPKPGARPDYDGYKFVGWYSSSDFAEGTLWDFDNDRMPAKNLTLYAKWTTHEHRWSYRIPEGKDNIVEIYCDNDDVHIKPPCDYFDNGNADDRGEDAPLTVSITTSDILHDFDTYDGITVVDEITPVDSVNNSVSSVTYYRVDEENGNTESKTTADNSGATAEGGAPKNKGYYVAKVVVNIGGDEIELKSYFRIKSVPRTVTFVDNQFSTTTAPVEDIIENTLIPKPADPQHDYYRFGGWYTAESFDDSEKWDFDNDLMPDNDLTLYANWIAHEHHWVFEQPAGSDNEVIIYCDSDDVEPIPPCDYYDDGNDSHKGSDAPLSVKITTPDNLHDFGPYDGVVVDDEITPVDPSKVIVGPVIYYRVDEENGNAETITTEENSGATTEGGAPSDKGYYVAKVVVTGENGEQAEIKSYFRIKPVPRKVTFVDNLYHTETAPVENIVEKTLIPQPTAPHVDYKAFDGWYTSENYLPDEYWDFATDLMPDNDLTLYAKWLNHEHSWVYQYKDASTLMVYCNGYDVEPYPPCSWYAEDLGSATNPLVVSIATPNTTYSGSVYSLAEFTDTLSGVDDVNNNVGDIVYYINSNPSVLTNAENSGAESEGGAPKNAGWYFAKVTVTGPSGTYDIMSSFKINRATLHDLNLVIDPEVYTANGSEIEAQYEVTFQSLGLVEGVDYQMADSSVYAATEIGQYAITVEGINNCTGTATKTWRIVDASLPEGKITIDGLLPEEYTTFIPAESTTFGRYFNTKQKLTVTASDADTPNDKDLKVSYFIAANAYSKEQLKSFPDNRWMPYPYGKSITLSDNRQYAVYVKIEDPSGNVSYISSQGFEIDLVKPVIVGVAAGKTYCNPAMFSVNEEESGIASVLIDGVESYVDGKTEYEIPGVSGDNSPHSVTVKDKAGNETTVSKIYVNADHEHVWVDAESGTAPTCLEDGEKTEKCKVCGAIRHIHLDHGEHLWDYDDDDCWSIVWTWDDVEKTYQGKAYLYCKNDCGTFKEFDCEITTEITEPEKPGEEEKVIFTAIVEYPNPNYPGNPDNPDDPDNQPTKKKEFEKDMPLSDIRDHGESELATGIIVVPGAPVTTAIGLNTQTAEGVLTDAEKDLLDNGSGSGTETESDENVKIIVYLEVSNIQGSVPATDKTLAINDFKDEIGSKANLKQIKYIDLSMYKRVITEKIKYTVPVSKDEQTEKLPEYSSDMTANIDVNGLSFPAVKKGYERTYYVSRVHDYSDEQDGTRKNAQIVYKGAAVNGKIPITTKLFCTYAITYSDERKGNGGNGGGNGDGGGNGGNGGNGDGGGNGSGTTYDNAYLSTMAYANGNMIGTLGFVSPKTGDNRHPVVWGILFVVFAGLFIGMTKFLKDVGLFKIVKKLF